MKNLLSTFLIVIIFFIGCEKSPNNFPQVSVNLNLSINLPEFFNLNNPGGWMYINGGVGGILLYRQNLEQFIAYDRASPFNPNEKCQTEVTNDNITISDPCSKSLFLITDGSVIQGPATQGLMRYNTHYDGQNLIIFN